MATFYPSMDEILHDQMEKHTPGELALLQTLAGLPDDYSIYFQPHINFAHPDIILLHPQGGALIIEVKDWSLSSYSYTPATSTKEFGYLQVKGENARLTTPFAQVDDYKKEFFKTLCPELLEESIRLGEQGRNVYGVIKNAVYFHQAANSDVIRLFGNGEIKESDGVKKYKKYITYWCREDLSAIRAQVIGLMRPHPYFNPKLYDAMRAFLVPSDEWLEQTESFDLSKLDSQQKLFAQCTPGQWSRIKGAAGSGKTLVIAQKAINCFEQKRKPVLILTYNITLRNYIRDRIAQNTRQMSQRTRENAFEILHYDAFLPQICKRLELQGPKPSNFKDADGNIQWEDYHQALADLLVSQKQRIVEYDCQYETILIDEAQDYESKWFTLIEQLFLTKGAEFMVVADEKQNLYGRQLEDKLPRIPGFRGPWRRLELSYRLSQMSFDLACGFQREFMTNKYDIDLNDRACLSTEKGSYRFFSVPDAQRDKMANVWEIVNAFRQEGNFTSPNDICILLNDIDSIRTLEKTIKSSSVGLNVLTMCETDDEFKQLLVQKQQGIIADLPYELEKLRSMRKFRFNMNSGTVKLCTIHSFKGWEISTVVLVLDDSENVNDELVYTAITRAKRNVIVISLGNERYDNFFRSFTRNHDATSNTEQRKDEPATMRQSFDSTRDFELSDVPTEYVRSSRYGFGHVDSVGNNGTIRVTFADGKTMDTNYMYFHNKGELDYIRLVPKKSLFDRLFAQKEPSSKSSTSISQPSPERQTAAVSPNPTVSTQVKQVAPAQQPSVAPAQSRSVAPALHADIPEKKVIPSQQIMSTTPIQLNGNLVQIMLEPAEKKKMFQYLSVHQPELMEDCPDPETALQYVVEHVFPASIQTSCIVSNYCCTSEATGKPIREFAIRSCDNTYLKKRLEDPNRQLKIHGLLNPSNIFRVKDIEVVSQSECTENEHQFSLRFFYPTENPKYPQRSALDEIAKLIPSYALTQEDELGLWTEYIDWKQRLAEIKVFGIKYIDYQLMEMEDGSFQFHFLAVMPDNQNRARMTRLANKERDQISVFASTVSKNQWVFVFNQENKYTNDLGLRLASIKPIVLDNWISEGDSRALNNCLAIIEKMTEQYPEPCYADISFDIPEEYEDKFAEEDFSSDQMYDFLEAKLVRNIPSDGFVATSRVGDFALNRRLKDALTSLRGGHAVSGNLGNWLFDIQLAHEAQTRTDIDAIEWSPWGKTRLNNSQKELVRKMLDAPEVFLCQGPPGTGKTTVIAEAVYQFALRKKRVLIASQTNLAVNNALSKLLGYPGIRAIRLGGQGKIDSSVEHITEENILRTFYGNVKNHIQQRYFQKWDEIDASVVAPKNDQIAAHKAFGQKTKAYKKYATAIAQLRQVAGLIEQYNEDYDQEDSDSDLRYLQLAVSVLTGINVENGIRIGSDDCDFLLMGLHEPLTQVQKLGYSIIPSNLDISGLSELPRRRKAALVRNALKLFAIVSAYRYSPTSDDNAERMAELKNLEQQKNDLLNSAMDDYSSFLKLKEITARINELKPQIGTSSEIVFPDELTDFLPEKYRSFVENYGMNPTIMNRIANDIGSVSLDAVAYVANYMLVMQEKAIHENEIENTKKVTALYQKCADVFVGLKDIQKEIAEHQNLLETLAVKYNCSIDGLEDTIKALIETLKKQDHEAESARTNFEVFFRDLIDYIGKLSDENQYKLENDVYQAPFINACNVVGVSCTERTKTLTDKGFDKFDVVIIDEVSKATPPEMLIPLLLAEKAILVGDHRQLPPLFNEHYASYQELRQAIDYDDESNELITDENYSQFEGLVTNSLFKRHYERAATSNKGALLVQYRMHREIMNVVNSFYNGLLTSGWSVEEEGNEKKHFATIFNPRGSVSLISPEHHAYWIDSSVIHGQPVYEKQEGSSKVNDLEIALIANLVQQIDDSYAAQGFDRIEVGVISFYGRQVKHLREAMSKLHLKCVRYDVNTVDRFQGKEKPIVIVSLVRNVEPGKPYDASYVQAYQRMNVAFSRAQNLLIMVGAQAMYTQQDIIIENMENGEKLPPRKVYKDIVERLEMNGCRFTADEILGPNFDDTIFWNH